MKLTGKDQVQHYSDESLVRWRVHPFKRPLFQGLLGRIAVDVGVTRLFVYQVGLANQFLVYHPLKMRTKW